MSEAKLGRGWTILRGAALLAALGSGCDAIIGLGAEPNGGSGSTGASAQASGASVSGSSATGGASTSTSDVSASSTGGDGGGGASSTSTADASTATGPGPSTGGGGTGGTPAGSCGECGGDGDCRGSRAGPGACIDGFCRVRTVDFASQVVDLSGSRGLGLFGRHAAFLARQGGAAKVVIADLEAGLLEDTVDVEGGGSVVATDVGFAYLSLGDFVGAVPSVLRRWTCDVACTEDAPITIDSANAFYSALGWLGDGRFVTSVNTGSGALKILTPRDQPSTYDVCDVGLANAIFAAPVKCATDGDTLTWSRIVTSPDPRGGEAVETLSPVSCPGAAEDHFLLTPQPTTYGIAIHGDDIAYTGTQGVEYNAWVNREKAVNASDPNSAIKTGYVPGLAFRDDGTLLVPGDLDEAMWDCHPESDQYRCVRYDLQGAGSLHDVYEIATDANRVVVVARTADGYRFVCVDESIPPPR